MCLGLEEGLKRKHLQEKKNAQELTSCELLFCDIKVLREKKSVHEKGNTGTGLISRSSKQLRDLARLARGLAEACVGFVSRDVTKRRSTMMS